MPILVLQLLAATAATVTIATGLLKLYGCIVKTIREARAPAVEAATQLAVPLDAAPVEAEPAPAARFNNMPLPLNQILGRDKEILELRRLMVSGWARLITLVGPGGVGKTRLALEAARIATTDFAGGTAFVSLASVRAENVLLAIGNALDVDSANPVEAADRLKAFLKGKRFLLVLDNFENVTDAAPKVADLLTSCPQLSVLVTSRALLHIRGEHVFQVQPLATPPSGSEASLQQASANEAVKLFVERARERQPDFELTVENQAAVVEIVRRLEGLPLALELAAARIRLLPPDELVKRLGNRLKLLTGGSPEVSRQQTMREAISWSFELLSPDEQVLFQRLALFTGGFTLEAAEAVGRDSGDVLEILSLLVDKSLLQQHNGPRFTMMEILREYGLERLDQNSDSTSPRWQYADYFLELLRRESTNMRTPRQAAAVVRLNRELGNLRASFEWLLARQEYESAMEMAGLLRWFWMERGWLGEGKSWATEALQHAPQEQSSGRALALLALGEFCWSHGDLTGCRLPLEEAVRTLRALGNNHLLVEAVAYLGNALVGNEDPEASERMLLESAEVARRQGDTWGMLHVAKGMGIHSIARGAYATAAQHFQSALSIARASGDLWSAAYTLNALGDAYRCLGDYDEAERRYEESLQLFQHENAQAGVYQSLIHNFGYIALHRGDWRKALTCFRESLNINQENQDYRGVAEGLVGIAGALGSIGSWQAAARLFGASESLLKTAKLGLWPSNLPDYQRSLAETRRKADESRFVELWREGAGLSLDEAVCLATNAANEATSQAVTTAVPV